MTFEDVVKQLQMNNRSEAGRDSRQTKMLGDLKTAIEGLTVATEKPDESAAAAEEDEKDERSRAKKLLDAVGGLKDSIGSAFKDVGAIKTGVPGLTLGLLAKLAVIPLLIKFLQSDLWLKIKEALIDPNVSALGMLFGDFKTEMTLLTALVGAFAIGKIIDIARKLSSSFGAIAASLTTLGAVVGIGKVVSAGTLGFIILGIVSVVKGLFDAFSTFKETLAETGSIFESIKDASIALISNIFFFQDIIKEVVAIISDIFGFEQFAEQLRSFSVVDIIEDFIKNGIDTLQMIVTEAINALSKIPQKVRDFFAEVDLFSGIRETLSEVDIFGPVRTFLAELPDRIQELMPDVGAIFEDAKQKVLDAVDRVKASIPTPDFSIIGQKITDLANFFSPTRILTSIGDSINERFQPDGIVGKLTKKAIMKIFPTSPVEVDEPVIGRGSMQVREAGGFLGAKQFALVGEQGPELIMSKAPMQVFSEQRTDQLGMAALNRLMGGGDGGGGSGTMFLNTGSNVQNVNKQTIVTPIVDQDPVIRQVSRSIMA